MKQKMMLVLFCCFWLITAAGCGKSGETPYLPLTGVDGDSPQVQMEEVYYWPYDLDRYQIPDKVYDFMRKEDKQKVHDWPQGYRINSNGELQGSRPVYEDNVYNFIHELGISKEDFLRYNALSEPFRYTEEEVALLYSGDEAKVKEYFCADTAIFAGGEVYNAEWIARHTPEDYKHAGITPQMLAQKEPLWGQGLQGFPEQWKTLKEHIDAYLYT